MKYIKEFLADKLHIAPLGNMSLGPLEVIPGTDCSGEELIIDGVYTGIYIAHCDYADWLEEKYGELIAQRTNDIAQKIDAIADKIYEAEK